MALGAEILVIAVVGLAYANGANDNLKGVATLVGSGVADYGKALLWATVTTLAGSLCAVALSAALLETFSGSGLVPPEVLANPAFILSVASGAAGTVFVATLVGLPISTTHSLVGGLCGAGLALPGGSVYLQQLGSAFLIPLVLGPVAASGLMAIVYPMLHRARRAMGVEQETYVYVKEDVRVPAKEGNLLPVDTHSAAVVADEIVTKPFRGAPPTRRLIIRATSSDDYARERYAGKVWGISAEAVATCIHYLSGGAVCFARGVNDTPKIVALLLTAQLLPSTAALILVGGFMALGGLIQARRVTATMSYRITAMNQGQALTANLVTAFLVLVASRWGMPASTTHVSCGSLIGLGAVTAQARWRSISTILGAWVITLPLAAALAALVARIAG